MKVDKRLKYMNIIDRWCVALVFTGFLIHVLLRELLLAEVHVQTRATKWLWLRFRVLQIFKQQKYSSSNKILTKHHFFQFKYSRLFNRGPLIFLAGLYQMQIDWSCSLFTMTLQKYNKSYLLFQSTTTRCRLSQAHSSQLGVVFVSRVLFRCSTSLHTDKHASQVCPKNNTICQVQQYC